MVSGATVDPFAAFRYTARRLLAANIAPEDASFETATQPALFGGTNASPRSASSLVSMSTQSPLPNGAALTSDVVRNATAADPESCGGLETHSQSIASHCSHDTVEGGIVGLPRPIHALLAAAACHADPARLGVMYRVLWRVAHGERDVLDAVTDGDVVRLRHYAKEVDRECHKMHAFVRFREIAGEPCRYVAYFAPVHDVLRRTAPFFVDRFATLSWTIATPYVTAHWDRKTLHFAPPPASPPPPPNDDTEALWLAYYESIFNPSRLNERLMKREMPVRYWRHLPEAQRIPHLVAQARERTAAMIEHVANPDQGLRVVAPVRPGGAGTGDFGAEDLPLKARLDACRRCELWKSATQGVAGRGSPRARIMLVGEQPGDEEDLAGEPFVGPAGRLLAKALAEAGVDPATAYVTNAVKHFKWELRGKRRIHKTPAQREVEACRVWLDGEVAHVEPKVLVALGATALVALLQRKLSIREARGQRLLHASGARLFATYHPSAALRAPTPELREDIYRALVEDLRAAQAAVDSGPAQPGA